jgi:hypothetical protein
MSLLPTNKNHISFSEIKNWNECSWRHHLAYVKKIDMFVPNVHVAVGTATHNTIEHFLKTKEMKPSIAREYLEKYLEDNGANEKFVKYSVDDEMKRIASMLNDVPTFLDENYPNWEFIAAEEQLMESVKTLMEGHDEVTFKGFIDCVIAVPGKKEGTKQYHLLDWKTASRPWGKEKLRDDNVMMQLKLYKKFWSEKHKIDMKDIRCAYIVLIKTAKPGKHCQKVDVSVGDVSAKRSLDVIDNMLTAMKNGIKIKNRMACKWCDFKGTEWCP